MPIWSECCIGPGSPPVCTLLSDNACPGAGGGLSPCGADAQRGHCGHLSRGPVSLPKKVEAAGGRGAREACSGPPSTAQRCAWGRDPARCLLRWQSRGTRAQGSGGRGTLIERSLPVCCVGCRDMVRPPPTPLCVPHQLLAAPATACLGRHQTGRRHRSRMKTLLSFSVTASQDRDPVEPWEIATVRPLLTHRRKKP